MVAANPQQHSKDEVQRFEQAVAASPPIVQCLSTTGQANHILTVLMPDIATCERFLHDAQFKLPATTRVRSSIVLRELKYEVRLPL